MVRYFCPCSEIVSPIENADSASLTLDTFPSTITNNRTLHHLANLSFCQHCHAIKCRKCIEVEILYKFCPHCMKEMDLDRVSCSKNCFDCPLCESPVTIKLDSTVKVYHMNCVNCNWKWDTGILEAPRSLTKIVKSQKNQKDMELSFFNELQQSFLNRNKSDINDMDLDKQLLIQFEELKLTKNYKDSSIYEFLEDISIKHSLETSTIAFPRPTKLRTKSSKRCKACRTSLMKPELDSFSTKFYKLSNAIDYLPSIELIKYPEYSKIDSQLTNKYLIIMKNPLNTTMTINLSSTKDKSQSSHNLYLPVSNFIIGSKPENYNKLETFIKTIPYVELTRKTKMARTELMNRTSPNFDNFESVVEQNQNFVVIPVKVSSTSEDHEEKNEVLSVPLFVSVKSDEFNTGFWSVLEI